MRLVVVGDLLLDRDVSGTVERVCPDAPAPVLAAGQSRYRPGGAGLAAALAAELGLEVTLVAGVAQDRGGSRLRGLLAEAGVDLVALPMPGGTPEKVRIRAGDQVLVRVDRDVPAQPPTEVPEAAVRALRSAQAVLVSDYGRGVTGVPGLREALADVASRRPVIWDPHPRGSAPVPGIRVATPNEAELAREVPRAGAGARLGTVAERAAALRSRWRAGAVVVTLGADGALVASGGTAPLVVPGMPCTARDTCGAGDRFAAALAAGLARGAVVSEAVADAVVSAGEFVAAGAAGAWRPRADAPAADREPPAERDGSAAGGAVGREAALAVVRAAHARGGTVVATGGCFDLLHVGHLSTLRAARRLGDCLIVLLNSDESVRALKGEGRPVVPGQDRARLVAALDCVDAVVTFDELTPHRLLAELRPDVWVKGGDYFLDGPDGRPALPEAELMRGWGGQAVVVPYLTGRSTTQLIAAVQPDRASYEGGNR